MGMTVTQTAATGEHPTYFLAGHPAPAGIYRETQTGHKLRVEEEDLLPATCDGHVAVYVRQAMTWADRLAEDEEDHGGPFEEMGGASR